MIGALVKMWLKEERKTEYLDLLREDGELSLLEDPGPLRFDVYEDPEDPSVVYLYEAWPTLEVWKSHMESNPAVQKLGEIGPDCVIKKEILIPGWTTAFWPTAE